ncbi:DUF4367 domain-containing protein [Terrisporobacter glycolicus]|uniref:DUF4367 domain-containing protein n=1 Tax=Terrisporobacter glycolicus TaxID=36841 RepID=UPI003463983C
MDNKIDIDRMAYLIGEEDAMEELDKFTEPHNFSKNYESEKMKMIKKVNGIDPIPMPNRKGKGMTRKKTIVLIAAITATLALSITAYGMCRKFFVTANRDEEAGTVTYDVQYDVQSESKITEIPLINITPGYLPEGYEQYKGDTSKYSPNGEPSAEDGILIYQNDYIYQPESYNISNVEETTIGGVKAYIQTSEGMLYKYKIDLIYEEDGQIITVGGTVSLEELKKVAENIKYEVIPGEFLELYDPKAEGINGEKDDVYIAPAVPADHVFNLREELSDEAIPGKNLIFTVNKVEIMDKLPEVNENYFWDYGEYLEAINEDGTLKDYKRSVSIKFGDNGLNYVTETAGRKFAYVTLTLRNPSDKELKDVGVHPIIEYRTKASDGTLKAFPNDSRGGNEIAGGKWPIYFDQSDYSGTHFFFCDFEPNETKEVHLIYLLDDDHIDDAYFTQRGMSSGSNNGNGLINIFGSYVKIK